MARRVLSLALPFAALVIAGCAAGQKADITPQQQQARVEFLRDNAKFDDHELARLCPGLYPRDFLTNEDAYPKETKDHRTPRITQAIRDQARAAGCDVPSPQ